ncbi:MAG: YaiI/YqxD family protein [Alphaproteobacteria bacterium]
MRIWVDGDACPVVDEVLRVAARHGIAVTIVGNQWRRGLDPAVRQIVVPETPDAADDRIAADITAGDIAVTADIPLAARCLDRGALVVGHDGRPFDAASIGMALAMRDLASHLRETGERTGGPRPYAARDRSRFLAALEEAVRSALRND